MPDFTNDLRDSVERSRDYATAFLALSARSTPQADPGKYLEQMEDALSLLERAAEELDKALRDSAPTKGNGSDA